MQTRRRLQFKGGGITKKVRKKKTKADRSEVSKDTVIVDEDIAQTNKEKPSNRNSESTSLKGEEYVEWGPEINGYRFIGTQNQPQYYKQRHSFGQSLQRDSYEWSYLSVPDFVSNTDHYLEQKTQSIKPEITQKDLHYDEYLHEWEEIRRERLGAIIFPVRESEELTLENIRSFLQTSNDFTNALKIERVRWHPDKMCQVLKLRDEQMMAKITTCFQLINELWEQNKKRWP